MKNIFKLFALSLSIVFTQSSFAATWTWIGGSSNNWNTKANWSTSSAASRPQAGDDVFINSGTLFNPIMPGNNTITNLTINSGVLDVGTNNLTVSNRVTLVGGSFVNNQSGTGRVITSNLVLNAPSGFTLGGTRTFLLQVNGTMTLTNGILYTNSNDILQFMSGSAVTGASNISHVDGPVTKIGVTSFVFPVGSGNVYAPISMNAPASNSTYTAEYFPYAYTNTTTLAAGLDHISNVEHWIFNRVSGSNVNVTLSFTTARSGVVNSLTDLRVAKWDGSQWLNLGNGGTTGTTAAGTVVNSSAITTYSPFTLGSSSTLNPLPVNLLSFNAKLLDQMVAIKWSTTNEINNDYFTIEKSINGTDWTTLTTVDASESTENVNFYEAIDLSPVAGIQYYRLKQTDLNGQSKYCDKTFINFTSSKPEIVAYPNPCSDFLSVNLNSTEQTDLKLLNAFGQVVYSETTSEQNLVKIDLSLLPAGVYVLETMVNNEISTSKIVKK